jgi:predicted ferric reductase
MFSLPAPLFLAKVPQAASLLCLLLVLLLPPFRWLSYELFLRSHQALALGAVYAVWRHVPSDNPFPRSYVYICLAIPAFMFLLQGVTVIIRNGAFRHRFARATINHDAGAVKMQLHLPRPVKFEAGRYINLWIPSISFWSFFQTHPFMIVSWAATAQDTLDLLVEPRRGLTRELLDHAKRRYNINPIVMFSGPHGMDVAMDEYESVLMVASGFGIAALLPYLKKLIYSYNNRVGRARRIHVIWQISSRGRLIISETA